MAATDRPAALRLDGTELCRGRSDLYFPDRTLPSGRAKIAEAVALCGGCPRREACLEVGLANREVDGVWGGVDLFFVFGPEAWKAARRARERAAREARDAL